jgi:hypothetical protein
MGSPARKDISPDQQLIETLAEFVYDPLGYVLFNWDWDFDAGEGPDQWQADVLNDIGTAMRAASAGRYVESEEIMASVRIAVASGHGIGKSALISWILKWFMATRPHPQVVTTANTKNQLETKTWRELAKWNKKARDGHFFRWTATRFYHVAHPETWFAAAIPWTKERSEAFAGTHEEHVLFLFDEASIIDDIIWEVAEGAMTTPGTLWIAFGNPTQNTGRFRECFGKFRHRWKTRQIDSRTAKMVNQAQVRQWIEDYGEDSDFVRVRVKGQFPRASVAQFIPVDLVEAAQQVSYDPPNDHVWSWAPVVIGVDVARYGDDKSIIYVRQGLQTRDIRPFLKMDTMELANFVVEAIREFSPRAVNVDVVGIGAGVVDRLRQLGFGGIVYEVNGANAPTDPAKYYNKRAEIWGLMREWLKAGGSIPADAKELYDDLIGPMYGYDAKLRIQLEKKDDMKKRGLASPDFADALANTFATPLAIDDTRKPKTQAETDWEIVLKGALANRGAYNLDDGFGD